MLYIYRHRRLDNNQVFYIGKGTTCTKFLNSISEKKKFLRAFSKRNRNTWWSNTSKLGYTVEIISYSLTEDEANELEEFLISLYGRKDCCDGVLVNLTDGGEGTLGRITSEDQKKAIGLRNSKENNKWFKGDPKLHPMYGRSGDLNPFYGKKHSQDSITKMRRPRPSIQGANHSKSKIVLHTLTGTFYFSIREAAEAFNLTYSTLKSNLNGTNKINKTDFILT